MVEFRYRNSAIFFIYFPQFLNFDYLRQTAWRPQQHSTSFIKTVLSLADKKKSLELYHQECLERFGPFEKTKNPSGFMLFQLGKPMLTHWALSQTWTASFSDQYSGQARAKSLFLKEPYLDLQSICL